MSFGLLRVARFIFSLFRAGISVVVVTPGLPFFISHLQSDLFGLSCHFASRIIPLISSGVISRPCTIPFGFSEPFKWPCCFPLTEQLVFVSLLFLLPYLFVLCVVLFSVSSNYQFARPTNTPPSSFPPLLCICQLFGSIAVLECAHPFGRLSHLQTPVYPRGLLSPMGEMRSLP